MRRGRAGSRQAERWAADPEIRPAETETSPRRSPSRRSTSPHVAIGAGRCGTRRRQPPRRLGRSASDPRCALSARSPPATWYGHYWWVAGRFIVSTDDAYVGAKSRHGRGQGLGLCRRGRGRRQRPCPAGDLIARIDDGDYQLAVQTAKDNIATEQATIDRIGKQIEAQRAAIDQAKAQLASMQAGQTRAEPRAASGSRRSPRATIASPSGARAGASQPRSGHRRSQGRRSRRRGGGDQYRRAEGPAGRGGADLEAIADGARARPSAICPSPSSARRSTARSATAPCRPAITSSRDSGWRASCRSMRSISTPISRRRSSPGSSPGQRPRSPSMRSPAAP